MTSSPDYSSFASLNSSYSYSSYFDWDNYVAHTLTWYIIVGSILVSLFMVTIIGNLFVMVAFYRDRRINSKIANWYIVNLSVADFFVGLISLPGNFIWLMEPTESWPFGEIFCKLLLFVDYVVTMVPALAIICISLDRYWLLTKKLGYPKVATKRKAMVFIISMWTICIATFGILAFAWIPITGFEEVIEYEWNCELEATYNLECQVVIIVLFFFCPLVTIVYLNFIVYRNIRERSKGFVQSKPTSVETKKEQSTSAETKKEQSNSVETKKEQATSVETKKEKLTSVEVKKEHPAVGDVVKKQKLTESDGSTTSTSVTTNMTKETTDISTVSLVVQNSNDKAMAATNAAEKKLKKQKEFNRHRKAAITLAVLVGVFIMCWLPFYITVLLGTLCEYCVSDLAWEVTNNLLWCNSTINPFLYAAMNPHFRENFIKFLGLKKFMSKNRSEPKTPSTSRDDY